MQAPNQDIVNSWITLLTPIAVAILIVVQKWDASKARADAAARAENIRQNYQRLLDSHNDLLKATKSQIDMVSEIHGIFKRGKVTVDPPPPPPPPPPLPPPPPPESEIDKKKKILADALMSLVKDIDNDLEKTDKKGEANVLQRNS